MKRIMVLGLAYLLSACNGDVDTIGEGEKQPNDETSPPNIDLPDDSTNVPEMLQTPTLTAISELDDQIKIQWNLPDEGLTAVLLERRVANSVWKQITELSGQSLQYTDDTIMRGIEYSYRVRTQRTLLQDNQPITLFSNYSTVRSHRINDPQSTAYPGPQPHLLPGLVQAEYFDKGGEGVAYHDFETENRGLEGNRTEAVDLELAEDAGEGLALAYIVAGEWLTYSVFSSSNEALNISARIAATEAVGRMRVLVDEQVIADVNIPATGGWQAWQTISVLEEYEMPEGEHTLKLEMVEGEFNLNYLQFDPMVELTEPTAPSNLTAKRAAEPMAKNNTILLAWADNSDDETGFELFRAIDESEFKKLGILSSNSMQYQDKNLDAGHTYAYKIRAINGVGASIFSSVASVVIDAVNTVDAKGIYSADCAFCHGANGEGVGPFPNLQRDASFEELAKIIEETMPVGAVNDCDRECAEALATYIQANFVEKEELACDAASSAPIEQQLRLLTRREYSNTISDLLGLETQVADDFPVESVLNGYDNNAGASFVTTNHIDQYLAAAETLAEQAVNQSFSKLVSCNLNVESCANNFVSEFGLRAFRRPLSTIEKNRYQALFDSQNTLNDSIRMVIEAYLNSPNFLYRSEIGVANGAGLYQLTQYEIASALSYLFIGTMPDSTLLQAAATNNLNSSEKIEAQAKRLLEMPAAKEQMKNFTAQWLKAGANQIGDKDAVIYPSFTNEIRESMDRELYEFVNYVVFESTGTVDELMNANYVMVNDKLAEFYGVGAVQGDDFVKMNATNRGGLLSLGSVLASHAHANESSPIKRAVFVRERLMCQEMAPPPPDLDATPPGLDPTKTTRERFAIHSSDPSCASCHTYIDDLGYGFEGFDGIGAFRSKENGLTVDTSGVLRGLNSLVTTDEHNFVGTQGLATLLSSSDVTKSCITEHYYQYAFGSDVSEQDQCAVDQLKQAFIADGFNVQSFMLYLTTSPAFTLRAPAAQ